MELIAILFLIGLGYGVKGLADNVRGDLRKSREAKVKEAAKAAGGKLPKHQRAAVARRHTRGWWAREVAGGFPAARTGWHAGWIAHKTALARQQIIREEARTEHAETQTSFRKDLAEHQKRQAEARAELERELAAQQAKGSPATGKSAVEKAADEVSRKREEKAARERKVPPAATGTETAVPPLPADSVGGARRDARPARQAWEDGQERLIAQRHAEFEREMAGDSDWLRPGHRRCEGCGGRGSALGGTCPACRGFGNAPPSPMSPVALADAVCTACGNTGRPGDPVLADPGGNIHLSHAKEGQVRYWDALNRMRQAEREPGPDAARWFGPGIREEDPDTRHAEIDDAVIAADHDFEGEFDTHRACPRCGAEAGHACKPGCDAPPSELEQNPTASPTTTEGAPVTDTNYTAVMQASATLTAAADQDLAEIRQRKAQAQQLAEDMQTAEVDAASISAAMDLVDRYTALEQGATAAGEQAGVVGTTLQRGHGGLHAAHAEAPVRAAKREFYEGD